MARQETTKTVHTYTLGILAASKKIPETRVEALRKAASLILLVTQKKL